MSLPVERPEDCPTRMAVGLGGGFAAGAILGAVVTNWSEVPQVLRDKPWPALVRTGSVMAHYGATLALVGGTFATVEVRLMRRLGRQATPCARASPPLLLLLPAAMSPRRCLLPLRPSHLLAVPPLSVPPGTGATAAVLCRDGARHQGLGQRRAGWGRVGRGAGAQG